MIYESVLLNLFRMSNLLKEFKSEIYKLDLSKTERYWLEQVNFEIENESLSIFVGSDFVKSSIEKKLYKQIKKTFKTSTGFKECVFVLDKKMKKDFQTYEFEEKKEAQTKSKEEIKKIQPDLSVFDELFVGSSNNLSITAAKNVVKDPGGRFNPLFVYGSPGVGKTYLLKTIEKAHPSSFYIDSESFLDSYIQGIKNKDIDIFKSKIRSVDILLVDDIQFFMGKKGVSEELFHTINYFLNNQKAVVLVSDQKPNKLLGFPDRLISRILNGLVTDIEKPDEEMFLKAIEKANVEQGGYLLSKEEIKKISGLRVDSFRDINGIVNQLLINKQTGKSNFDYIKELVSASNAGFVESVSADHILDYVSNVFQVDKNLISSKNRTSKVNESRRLFASLARKHTDLSLNQIGLYLGGRSHSTVLSYIDKSKDSPLVIKEINNFDSSLSIKEVG
jgi:chromosomal replication initiator protein